MEDIIGKINYESEEEKNLKKILSGEFQSFEPYPPLAQYLPDPNINPAKRIYEIIVEYIEEFQKNLDLNDEVGAHLVSFGREYTFHIINIDYSGPNVIVFYGLDKCQRPLQLIQNINQLNILLVALPKLGEKPRRFGFNLDGSN